MRGSLHEVNWYKPGLISVSTTRSYSGCDPDYFYCDIPEAWLYDEEARALGLAGEFDKLVTQAKEAAQAREAKKQADERAAYEALRAKYEK